MKRREQVYRNPIGVQVVTNILIALVLLSTLGVYWVHSNMKRGNKLAEVKKQHTAIARLEKEIEGIKMEIQQLEDNGRLASLMREKQLDLVPMDLNEVKHLPEPTPTSTR